MTMKFLHAHAWLVLELMLWLLLRLLCGWLEWLNYDERALELISEGVCEVVSGEGNGAVEEEIREFATGWLEKLVGRMVM